MEGEGEIRLSKDEIGSLLFPYKREHLYLTEATISYRPPKRISLSAKCILPVRKPTYLSKEIDYITATEGLALVTRSFILMFVAALTRWLLHELRSSKKEICRDPEVFTLSVVINCRKRIQRNVLSDAGVYSEKPISVKVWLDDDWAVEKRRDRRAFKGTVKFQIEGGRWDGQVETFIWLE